MALEIHSLRFGIESSGITGHLWLYCRLTVTLGSQMYQSDFFCYVIVTVRYYLHGIRIIRHLDSCISCLMYVAPHLEALRKVLS